MKRNKINRKFRRNLAVSLMTLCSAQEMIYGMDKNNIPNVVAGAKGPNIPEAPVLIPNVVGPQQPGANIPQAPVLIPNVVGPQQLGPNIPMPKPVPGVGIPVPKPVPKGPGGMPFPGFGAPPAKPFSTLNYFPLAEKCRNNTLSEQEKKTFELFQNKVNEELLKLMTSSFADAEKQGKKDCKNNAQLVPQMGIYYSRWEYSPEMLVKLEDQLRNRFINLQNLLGPILENLPREIENDSIKEGTVKRILRPDNVQKREKKVYPSIITIGEEDNVTDEELEDAEKRKQLVAKLKVEKVITVPYSDASKDIICNRDLGRFGPGKIIAANIEIPIFTGLKMTNRSIPINLRCVLTYSGSTSNMDTSPVEIYFTPKAFDHQYLDDLKKQLSDKMETSMKQREEFLTGLRNDYSQLSAKNSALFKISIQDQLSADELTKAKDALGDCNFIANGSRYLILQRNAKKNNGAKNKNNGGQNKNDGGQNKNDGDVKVDQKTGMKIPFLIREIKARVANVENPENPYLASLKFKVKLLEYITGSKETDMNSMPPYEKLQPAIDTLIANKNRNDIIIRLCNQKIATNSPDKRTPIPIKNADLKKIQISKDFAWYYGEQDLEDAEYFEESKKQLEENIRKIIAQRKVDLNDDLIDAKKQREKQEKKDKLEVLKKRIAASVPAKGTVNEAVSQTYEKIKDFPPDVARTLLDQLASNFAACAGKLKTTYEKAPNTINENAEIVCTQLKKDTKITLIDKKEAEKVSNDLFINHQVANGPTQTQILDKLNAIQRLNGEDIHVGKIKISTVKTVKGREFLGVDATTQATQILGSFDLYIYLFAQDTQELTPIEVTVPFMLLQQQIGQKSETYIYYFPEMSDDNIARITSAVEDKLTKRHINSVLAATGEAQKYGLEDLKMESVIDQRQYCDSTQKFIYAISTKIPTTVKKKEDKVKDPSWKQTPGQTLLDEVKRSRPNKYVPDTTDTDKSDMLNQLRKKVIQGQVQAPKDIKSIKKYFAEQMVETPQGPEWLSGKQIKQLYEEYPLVMQCAQKVATEYSDRDKIKPKFIKAFKLPEGTKWNPDDVYYNISDENNPVFKYGHLTPNEKKYMKSLKEESNLYLRKTELIENKQNLKKFLPQMKNKWQELNNYAQSLYKQGLSNKQIQQLCNEKIKNEIARVGTMEDPERAVPLFNVFMDLPMDAKYDANLVYFDPIAQKVQYGHDKNKKQSSSTKALEQIADQAGNEALFEQEMEALKKKKNQSQNTVPLSIGERNKLVTEFKKIEEEFKDEEEEKEHQNYLNTLFVEEDEEDKVNQSDEDKEAGAKLDKITEITKGIYQAYHEDQEKQKKLQKEMEEKKAKEDLKRLEDIREYIKKHQENMENDRGANQATLRTRKTSLDQMKTFVQNYNAFVQNYNAQDRLKLIQQLDEELTQVTHLLNWVEAAAALNIDINNVSNHTQEELEKLKNDHKNDVEKLKNDHKNNVDELKSELDKLEKDYQNKVDKLKNDYENEINKLKKESTDTPVTSEGSSSPSMSKEDDERYNQLADQWSYLDSVNSQLTSENNSLNSKIEDLQKQLNDLKAENEELSKENKEKDSQLQNATTKTVAAGSTALAAGAAASKIVPKLFTARTATDLAKRGITTIGQNLAQKTVSNLAQKTVSNLAAKTVSDLAAAGIEEASKQVASTVASDIIEKGIDTATKAIT